MTNLTVYNLQQYIDTLLNVHEFKDYCHNGIQVDTLKNNVTKVVSAVSCNQNTILKAKALKADTLLVHHGLIWGGLKHISGITSARLQLLFQANMNLLAYHLPLDYHAKFGNNQLFGSCMNFTNITREQDIYLGEFTGSFEHLCQILQQKLNRTPRVIGKKPAKLKKIAWCTGAGEDFIGKAKDLGADVFISGEVKERTLHEALELDITYIEVGHYVSETFGVRALGEHLAQNFALKHEFVHEFNPL